MSFSINSIIMVESILWQLPNFFIWKDIHSSYLGCNKNFALAAGYSSLDSIVGIKDEDLKCEASSYASTFRSQDNEAMSNHPQVVLDIHRFADDKIWTCISQKSALKDDQGNVIGCINQMSEINIPLLSHLGLILIQENAKLSDSRSNSLILSKKGYANQLLTIRESECLFYLIRGKTAKEIAKAIAISPRTVETHLENIKHKFQCRTKSQLIEKSITLGLLPIIPSSLLSFGFSTVIKPNE